MRGVFRGVKIRSATFTEKADAEKYLREEERRVELGLYYDAPAETFGAFLDGFIERKRQMGCKPKTIAECKDTAKYLEPLRDRFFPVLRRAEVEDMIAALGPRRRAQRSLMLLKSVLHAAQDRGQRVDETIFRIPAPRYESKEPVFLTAAEMYALSSWMPGYVRRIVPVAGLTGLRQGEILSLKDTDLEMDEAKLHVRSGKTKASRRTVNLSQEVVGLLREQLLERPAVETEYVFPDKEGKRWIATAFMAQVFRPARELAGMGCNFHSLRHSYASLMVRAGVDVTTIADEMGHVDGGALLLRRYSHLRDDAGKRGAAMLDALLAAEG